MAWFFLTLLIVESVHTLNVHEDSRTLLTEDKKEKGIMAEAALRNEDICEDWLHRMQREASIQNLFGLGPYERNRRSPQTQWPAWQRKQHSEFMKTDWQPLEQDNNVQQLPSELMTSGANVDKWKSSIQIKKRKKRAATRKPCPEFRKKIHSEFMKAYWRDTNDRDLMERDPVRQSRLMRRYWKYRKDEANSSGRFQRHKEFMKAYWKRADVRANTERHRKHSDSLKQYWFKLRGDTNNPNYTQRNRRLSEKLTAYWQKKRRKEEYVKEWETRLKKREENRNRTKMLRARIHLQPPHWYEIFPFP
uniref:Uncharacterized protein n=1 Tax=Cacopsylla melanoneura TaxID=428564 RepID=A0A8D8ZWN4_9HEMI